MLITHISSANLRGGAGRSALRLHRGLLALGQPSRMLVDPANRESIEPGVEVLSGPERRESRTAEMIQRDCIRRRRTPVSNTFFSSGYPGTDLRQHAAIQSADIIHLHWVSGRLSPPAISALLFTGKPIVWTLHDQRAFTGGCHFSAGCRQFEEACAACPQILSDTHALPAANLADEILLLRSRGIHLVSPSHWLADCARKSAVFSGGHIDVIPYGVETDLFHPGNMSEARAALGLPLHGFHLLFGADFGAEKRKGFSELSQALRLCSEDGGFSKGLREKTITISYFGRAAEEIDALGMPIHAHGHIASDERMAMLYASASLYVLPSLEDNLPNTLLECMSSGTPAVAFNAGGIPDLLKDQATGWLVPKGDARGLASAIVEASRKPDLLASMGVSCRATIERTHTIAAQAGSYMSLYEGVMAGRPPTAKPFRAMPAFGPAIRRLLPFLVFRSLRERFRGRIRSLPLVGRFV